jgi:4-hydroxybenzoate polyprenyltransferase
MRAWGRLFRLSLAPSAAADIAAGVILAARVWPRGFAVCLLMFASLCVYHGGMALNDWADREIDERARPDRPIPSGRVPASSALAAALVLLAVGPVLAWSADRGSGIILSAVAIAAMMYDVGRRGAWRGPLLLAACRAGNLSAGIAYGSAARGGSAASSDASDALATGDRFAFAAIIVAYALYVFLVSRLGRLEDREGDEKLTRAPAMYLCGAACALLVPAAVMTKRVLDGELHLPREAGVALAGAAFVAVWGAGPLAVRALKTREWSKLDVLRAMGLALRRLLVFTAGTALLAGSSGWIVAAAILCGYPLSYLLRGVFPPS